MTQEKTQDSADNPAKLSLSSLKDPEKRADLRAQADLNKYLLTSTLKEAFNRGRKRGYSDQLAIRNSHKFQFLFYAIIILICLYLVWR